LPQLADPSTIACVRRGRAALADRGLTVLPPEFRSVSLKYLYWIDSTADACHRRPDERWGTLLRLLFVSAAILLLAGCDTDSGWRPHSDSATDEPRSAKPIRNAAKLANPNDSHCREIATQRADDAKDNRFNAEIQNLIYRGTYKDCIAWSAQHAP
jgi:hypothetical protein